MPSRDAKRLPVIIIGAGGHGKVLLDALEALAVEVLFVTDREPSRYGHKIGNVVICDDDEVFRHAPDQVRLVNGIGSIASMAQRKRVYDKFRSRGYEFETVIHPSAVVARSAKIGSGVQIMAGVIVQPGARIDENTIINTSASIDHDCVIGSHVHIAPGATLSGAVVVGDSSHIGTSAAVIQGVHIGSEALVAAGSVVIRNVLGKQRVAGVPAKQLDSRKASTTSYGEGDEAFTIMLSAAGRRVALQNCLRESADELGLRPRMLATDITRLGAAYHCCDKGVIVPPYSDSRCLDDLLEVCRKNKVRLIVPTIDPDLPFFSRNLAAFAGVGTDVMISSEQTIRICNDKRETYSWLTSHGFSTVRQVDVVEFLKDPSGWQFPVFVKPASGSSSIGAQAVNTMEELKFATRLGGYVVQELARGREYTIDVYVDSQGRCRCAVPRLRIETRSGEVAKAVTVRSEPLITLAREVAEALPGARGVLNVQVFFDAHTGRITVSEINGRFGGGYPLTHRAGAPMTKWVLEECIGRAPSINEDWEDGLAMLRYDEAVFVAASMAGIVEMAQPGPSTSKA